jgi:hypothetical protein
MGCNAQSEAVSTLFPGADPDMGIKFQFCKYHQAYYQYIITIIDNCVTTTQQMGKWVYAVPPAFSLFKKRLEDAEARAQPK